MRTSCNPGRWLRVEGSFEIVEEFEQVFGEGLILPKVRDRESGQEMSLVDLLRDFNYDPSKTVTGRIQITIEAK